MPTIQQLVRKGREVLVEKSKSPALDEKPSPLCSILSLPFNSSFLLINVKILLLTILHHILRTARYCSHDVRPATHLAILNRLWRWGEMHSSQNMHPPCQSAK